MRRTKQKKTLENQVQKNEKLGEIREIKVGLHATLKKKKKRINRLKK